MYYIYITHSSFQKHLNYFTNPHTFCYKDSLIMKTYNTILLTTIYMYQQCSYILSQYSILHGNVDQTHVSSIHGLLNFEIGE